MREQLISYVELLFAGAEDAEEIKQEILQNTLDRYDDLIAQGKSPQAAYSLAISGIGDIQDLLSSCNTAENAPAAPSAPAGPKKPSSRKQLLRALAICLYILCPVPLFVLQNEAGLCLLLVIVAAATALIILSGSSESREEKEKTQPTGPYAEIRKAVKAVISALGLCAYFLLSFTTQAWHITWLIFPVMAAVQGVATAVLDLILPDRKPSGAIVRIILFVLAILVLMTVLLGSVLTVSVEHWSDFFTVTSHTSTPGSLSDETVALDAGQIRDLEIDWVAGSITIRPDENTHKITVTETAVSEERYRMICSQSGDTLKIEYCQPGLFTGIRLGGTTISKDLEILVPAGWVCGELEIDTASAQVELTGLIVDSMDFNGASGSCRFTDCEVDRMELETVSGDVHFIGAITELSTQCVSANCTIEAANAPRRIDMEGVSGSLKLYLPEDCGFTANIDTVSGNFRSDFPTVSHGGQHVSGTGDCEITMEGISGDVEILVKE